MTHAAQRGPRHPEAHTWRDLGELTCPQRAIAGTERRRFAVARRDGS
jgi:hypothetical protein